MSKPMFLLDLEHPLVRFASQYDLALRLSEDDEAGVLTVEAFNGNLDHLGKGTAKIRYGTAVQQRDRAILRCLTDAMSMDLAREKADKERPALYEAERDAGTAVADYDPAMPMDTS